MMVIGFGSDGRKYVIDFKSEDLRIENKMLMMTAECVTGRFYISRKVREVREVFRRGRYGY